MITTKTVTMMEIRCDRCEAAKTKVISTHHMAIEEFSRELEKEGWLETESKHFCKTCAMVIHKIEKRVWTYVCLR